MHFLNLESMADFINQSWLFFQPSHRNLPDTTNDLLALLYESKPSLHLMSVWKGFP